MKIPIKLLVGMVLALSPALAAFGQSNDTAYCNKLSDTYKRYVGTESQHRGRAPDAASIETAISHCQSDAANSIPVIEKALKDAKVDLPPRS